MRPSWSTVGAVLALTTYAVDAVDVTGHTCPRLPCSKCLTPEEAHGVGIGFDLSAAYGYVFSHGLFDTQVAIE